MSMKRCGSAKVKHALFAGAEGYLLESKEFIMESYTKEEADEVFGDALERVGTDCEKLSDGCRFVSDSGGWSSGSEQIDFVKDYSIIVNKPSKFDGFSVFQMDFRLDELKSMTFQLTEKATGTSLGEFTVDLTDPKREYKLDNGARVILSDYYPDYDGIENGEPKSKVSDTE